MYVQVRMMDTGVSVTIPTSRTALVKDFKTLVEKKFNIKSENLRLFFAGKQVRIMTASNLLAQCCRHIGNFIEIVFLASIHLNNVTDVRLAMISEAIPTLNFNYDVFIPKLFIVCL